MEHHVVKDTLSLKMEIVEKERNARAALTAYLEFDASGMCGSAGLTFDQRVQYSIALSLKAISDRLEANADAGS